MEKSKNICSLYNEVQVLDVTAIFIDLQEVL